MAITQFWNRFGETILAEPQLTLAAFLGHPASVAAAKEREIRFPKTADFQVDPAYDPNRHKLDLDEDSLNSAFLMKCISAWGAEALIRAVNACSLLQCMHHSSCPPEIRPLRNGAAFALQTLIDAPSDEARHRAEEYHRQCEELYRPYDHDPDTAAARLCWCQLGAPWLGLETALGNLAAQDACGESEPAPSNSTWCARETVYPISAIAAAAFWSSHSLARKSVRSTLLAWALNNKDAYYELEQRQSRMEARQKAWEEKRKRIGPLKSPFSE